MCVSPVTIANPYFGKRAYKYVDGSIRDLEPMFVSQKPTIEVPCGKCIDCVDKKYAAILQRVQLESLTSYVYFCTLTYDDKHIPTLSFTTDFGLQDIYYADISHIQSMFKRLRNLPLFQERGIRYYGVTEYGTSRFRPHHHLMLFVAKKKDDDDTVKFDIEKYLWDNVQRYYSINVGTRKNPIYEKLFTYAERVNYATGKKERNYDVTLVRDKTAPDGDSSTINSADSIVKSLRYLISYITKPTSYDAFVVDYFDRVSDTLPLDIRQKLFRILKCRHYYSKHLGFGFYEDGSRVSPSLSCKSLSESVVLIQQQLSVMPAAYEDFKEHYPSFSDKLDKFIDEMFDDCARRYVYPGGYFRPYVHSLTSEGYFLLNLVNRYIPHAISALFARFHMSSQVFSPYLLPKGYDSRYKESLSYKTIRSFVEDGLTNKVPFLSFSYFDGSVKYVPLCSYYKRYCTTYDDVARLYNNCRVTCFDEYIELAERVDKLTKSREVLYKAHEEIHEQNRPLFEEDCEKIGKNNDINKINSIFVPTGSLICSLFD